MRFDKIFRNSKNRGTRHRPAAPATTLLTDSDFTYLGAYVISRDPMAGNESFFGYGLALRYENTDGTNPVHLLSAGYNSTYNHGIFEWRDATPGNGGADPLDPANYTDATILKTYGNVYSSKKTIIYEGSEVQLTNQLDGGFGIHWDNIDNRLYWCYGFGYSSGNPLDINSWCIGYSTLNYSGNTGTGFGPWRLTGQSWKAAMGGFVGIPSSYATTYLSGKRLAVGLGGYFSIHAIADMSAGPSLTSFNAITNEAEQASIGNTPLVGYWPYASAPSGTANRANRPEDMLLNATADYNLEPNWGATKFSWNDRVEGGVWIDTGTKQGVLFIGQYGKGYTQYVSSDMSSTKFAHWWAIYDPADFTPVSGTARYNIQPDSIYEVNYPTVDYTQAMYAGATPKAVSSITSTNGAALSSTTGAIVTIPNHGYNATSFVEIRGANQAEYNAIWTPTIIDSNSFYIKNTSLGSLTWSGTSATGTITAKDGITAGCDRCLGAAFDSTTNKLYVAVAVLKGVNGLNSRVFIHVYQVA